MSCANKRKSPPLLDSTAVPNSAVSDESSDVVVDGASHKAKKLSVDRAHYCLDPGISCSDELRKLLRPETIRMANEIIVGLRADDPGLVVQILNADDLHLALALPGSPVVQGADAAESADAFRKWLIARALATPGVSPNSQIPPNSRSVAFHHLTERNANAIVYGGWQVIPWVAEIQNQAPPVEMPLVLWMAGTGRGKCDMFVADQVFL